MRERTMIYAGYGGALVTLSLLPFVVLPTLLLPYQLGWTGIVLLALSIGLLRSIREGSNTYLKQMLKVTFTLFLLFVFVYYVSFGLVLYDSYGLERLLEQYGDQAMWVFAAFSFLQPIALPVPEAVSVPIGSVAFGPLRAALIGSVATTLGILVMYGLARFGRERVMRLIDADKLATYDRYVDKYGLGVLLVLFIIPILPDEIICLAAGFSRVPFPRFVLIAIGAKLVTSFGLAYSVSLGELFITGASPFAVVSVTASLLLVILALVWRKRKKGNSN
ncbi:MULTISPECIES: TVP38/TMEM64 family protein [unclassified Exiguobacterium]|uniref:TVP38/TMEM64 family protein n=1 Tax=unclassified Exiguobacterium TaxID=2644629 RepID=UPI00103C8B3E|nr:MULTISPECIES: VTT domain-containing protein [unclassified Exiguobacterium]TCI71416.1 TVP38/TMEM64 family protein [Exiguobacterium sp. IPCI3]TCI81394.1 TVP38/TMEM64 family protein [Exiguobacterium sp. IPCH1]TCI82591.1 TVP38/TMEM64 family protein [Exiguobacterium sp. IPBC4]